MKIVPPWFRVHLSTALVLMVAASVILGLNLKMQKVFTYKMSGDFETVAAAYGWPRTAYSQVFRMDGPISHFPWPPGFHDPVDEPTLIWDAGNFVLDAITASILLAAIAVVLEKRIAVLQRLKNREPHRD